MIYPEDYRFYGEGERKFNLSDFIFLLYSIIISVTIVGVVITKILNN